MPIVTARIEVPADIYHQIRLRAVAERKTLKQLVREIMEAAAKESSAKG